MGISSLLRIIALVLFVIAGVLAFGWIGNTNAFDLLGYIAFGLASWIASTMVPDTVRG
jgi:hypothetical protein